MQARPIETQPAAVAISPRVIEYAVPVLIALAYFLFRFNPGYRPFLWDEDLFIKAMHNGGLAFFPGYIGFLWSGRILSAVFSPGASLQFVSALFGALSVAVFWLWMRRFQLSVPIAAMGTLVFATGVYQLYNTAVGVTYPTEPFAYLLTGYLCDRAAHNRKALYGAAVVLALCGAVRQSTPVFLMPLFLYCCWRARTLKPVLLFGGLALVWFIPTVVLYSRSGGILAEGQHELNVAVLPSTVTHSPRLAAVNFARFLIYLAYGAHVLLLFAIPRFRGFELLWVVPGALFFAFYYIAWPGYMLGVLAVIVLLGVRTIARFRAPVALALLAAIALIDCVQFYVMHPIYQPRSTVQAVVSVYALQYSNAALDRKYAKRLRDVMP
jgi:hypothetical protein